MCFGTDSGVPLSLLQSEICCYCNTLVPLSTLNNMYVVNLLFIVSVMGASKNETIDRISRRKIKGVICNSQVDYPLLCVRFGDLRPKRYSWQKTLA